LKCCIDSEECCKRRKRRKGQKKNVFQRCRETTVPQGKKQEEKPNTVSGREKVAVDKLGKGLLRVLGARDS